MSVITAISASHPSPIIPPHPKVSQIGVGFRAFCLSDLGDSGDSCTPPGVFLLLVQTKVLSQVHPRMAPARRLGGPWATLGPHKGHPIPNPIRQRVATHLQVPKNQVPPLANCQLLQFSMIRRRSHPKALPDYSCFIRPNQWRIRTCPRLDEPDRVMSACLRLAFGCPSLLSFIFGVKPMADSKAHTYFAVAAGVGMTAYVAKEQTGFDFWFQLLGAALGARCTGNLPDFFEPAISSYHWGTFHSVGMGGTITAQANRIADFRKFCQSQADECKTNPKRILMIPVAEGVMFPIELDGVVGKVLSLIERCFWLILSGFVVGAAAGYVSHLALDEATCKRSLPLLKKGF
jgi:hypothetical protein